MEGYFIAFWILSMIMIIVGLICLTIGIAYKKWKNIITALFSLVIGILFYYLPYYIMMNNLTKALEGHH